MLSLEDQFAITTLIGLHGHLTDDGELERFSEVFSDDVVYDLSDFGMGQLHGVAAVIEAGRALGDANPVGHHVTNVVIHEESDGRVLARSKGISVSATGVAGSVVYEDVLERRAEGWRICARRVLLRRKPLGGT